MKISPKGHVPRNYSSPKPSSTLSLVSCCTIHLKILENWISHVNMVVNGHNACLEWWAANSTISNPFLRTLYLAPWSSFRRHPSECQQPFAKKSTVVNCNTNPFFWFWALGTYSHYRWWCFFFYSPCHILSTLGLSICFITAIGHLKRAYSRVGG